MNLGIILKGISNLVLGPTFTIISSIVNYIAGEREGKSTLWSLGLSGFLDFELDLEEFGYEIDYEYSKDINKTSILVGKSLLESGVEQYLNNYDIKRRPSGLYVANIAILDVSQSDVTLNSVWKTQKKKYFNKRYNHMGTLDIITSDIISYDNYKSENMNFGSMDFGSINS
jgi:hypothetical protein